MTGVCLRMFRSFFLAKMQWNVLMTHFAVFYLDTSLVSGILIIAGWIPETWIY